MDPTLSVVDYAAGSCAMNSYKASTQDVCSSSPAGHRHASRWLCRDAQACMPAPFTALLWHCRNCLRVLITNVSVCYQQSRKGILSAVSTVSASIVKSVIVHCRHLHCQQGASVDRSAQQNFREQPTMTQLRSAQSASKADGMPGWQALLGPHMRSNCPCQTGRRAPHQSHPGAPRPH